MFKEQVTTEVFLGDVLYWVATMATVLAVIAIAMIEFGLVRARNGVETVVQKLVASLIAAGAFLIVGNAIWYWQFNQAFGVPNALGESIKAWWIGGDYMTTFAQGIDPKVLPNADIEQVFVVFFASFAAIVVALIHSGGIERVRPLAMYIIAAVAGGIVIPFLLYLTWGPLGPLTNRGVHDFVGIYPGYIFAGGWAFLLAWRLGPRRAATVEERSKPQSLGITALGVGLLIVSIPLFVLGCGFLIPGAGYFGINMSQSGFGIVFLNCMAAFAGGTLTGAVIAYVKRNPFWALIGPVAGYISCAALLDFAKPWLAFAVALVGPLVAPLVDRLMYRLNVDEHKIVPLGLGCGSFGAIVAGFVGWGVNVGGFLGLEGKYALGHAEINPGWQLIGLGVTLAITFVSGVVLLAILDKTVGLRVSNAEEEAGLDAAYWDIVPEADDRAAGMPLPVA